MNTKQMAEELAAKRKALADIFTKHTVNGELEMPMSVVEEVRAKNAELDDLSRKYEQALDTERIANENKAALEQLERQPVTDVRFPVGTNQAGSFSVSTDARGNK